MELEEPAKEPSGALATQHARFDERDGVSQIRDREPGGEPLGVPDLVLVRGRDELGRGTAPQTPSGAEVLGLVGHARILPDRRPPRATTLPGMTRLNVHRYGPGGGEPVVCLHGVTGHGERFAPLAERVLTDRRVLGLDLRGHGRSTWDGPWNLEQHVADVVDTMDAEGIAQVPLVGHSFGGCVALWTAHLHPERVSALALIDPALAIPGSESLDAGEDLLEDESFASLDEAIEARMQSCTEAARPFVEADRRQHMVLGDDGQLRARFSRPVAIAVYGEMARALVHPEIGTRTLLLEASDFDLVQPDHVRRLRSALGNDFDHQVVKGGHSLLWDAFEETSAAIAKLLAPARTATTGG